MDIGDFRDAKTHGSPPQRTFEVVGAVRSIAEKADLCDTAHVVNLFLESCQFIQEFGGGEAEDAISHLGIGIDAVNLAVLDAFVEPEEQQHALALPIFRSLTDTLDKYRISYEKAIIHQLRQLPQHTTTHDRRTIEIESAFGSLLTYESIFLSHRHVYDHILKAQAGVDAAPPSHLAQKTIRELTVWGFTYMEQLKQLTSQPDGDYKQRVVRSLCGAMTEIDAAILYWSLIEAGRIKGWVLPAGIFFNEKYSRTSRHDLNTDLLFIQPDERDIVGLQVKKDLSRETCKYNPQGVVVIDGVVDLGNYYHSTNHSSVGYFAHPGNLTTVKYRILSGANLPDSCRQPTISFQNATTLQSARHELRRLQDLHVARLASTPLKNAVVA